MLILARRKQSCQLSPDVLIGEAVPCLGNFVDFSLLEQENETEITDIYTQANAQACAFKTLILISSANLSNHLPQKKQLHEQQSKIVQWHIQYSLRGSSTVLTSRMNFFNFPRFYYVVFCVNFCTNFARILCEFCVKVLLSCARFLQCGARFSAHELMFRHMIR